MPASAPPVPAPDGSTRCRSPGAPAHLTITRMPDGRPGEVFIQGGTGSAFAGYLARRLAHDYLNAGERAELGLTGR